MLLTTQVLVCCQIACRFTIKCHISFSLFLSFSLSVHFLVERKRKRYNREGGRKKNLSLIFSSFVFSPSFFDKLKNICTWELMVLTSILSLSLFSLSLSLSLSLTVFCSVTEQKRVGENKKVRDPNLVSSRRKSLSFPSLSEGDSSKSVTEK